MLTIPNVAIHINVGTTTRFAYEPRYVVPLIRARWVGAAGADADVEPVSVQAIDPRNPHTRIAMERVFYEPGEYPLVGTAPDGSPIYSELPEERPAARQEYDRLRQLYDTRPDGTALFDLVYRSFEEFEAAFDADARRPVEAPAAPAPASPPDLSELIDLPHVGRAYAEAIHREFGVATPAELVARVRESDLTKIRGIGRDRAHDIYEACVAAQVTAIREEDAAARPVLAGGDLAPGEASGDEDDDLTDSAY